MWHAETGALVGAHMIGPAVTDLIAELTLAKTTEVNADSLARHDPRAPDLRRDDQGRDRGRLRPRDRSVAMTSRPALLVLAVVSLGCKGKPASSHDASPPPRDAALRNAPRPRDAAAPPAADAATAPTEEPASASKVLQIVLDRRVACARRADGRVRCWGKQRDGTDRPVSAVPVEIPHLTNAIAIAATLGPLTIVTADGRILQLSDDLHDPKIVTTLDVVAEPIDVAVLHDEMGFALTRSGDVMAWDKSGVSPKPWATNVVAIVLRHFQLAALHRDGTVSWWSKARKRGTVRGLRDADGLITETCAHRRTGDIACWEGGAPRPYKGPRDLLDRVSDRDVQFTCDLTTAGVACSGHNEVGQLGAKPGTAADRKLGKMVELPAKATAIAAGDTSACALLATGEVACWGGNDGGQLGDGTLVDRSTPVIVAGLTTPRPLPPSDGLAAVQQASTPMDWSGLPAGCTRPGPLTAHRDAPYLTPVSAYVYAAKSSFQIQLADFQLEPTYRPNTRPARGRQRIFQLSLQRAPAEHLPRPGPYKRRGKRTASLVLHDGDTSADQDADALTVVLTHVDKTWVCGTIEITTNGKGKQPFAARVAH